MKHFSTIAGMVAGAGWIAGVCLLLTGCRTHPPRFVEFESTPIARERTTPLRVGETVLVTYPDAQDPINAEVIKQDGTVNFPVVGEVVAAGRTPKELQDKVNELLGRSAGRFFVVEGEVHRPGPLLYVGKTDLARAIAAAGGFTDNADKMKLTLIRANGKTEVIRMLKAGDPSELESVLVFPDDKIRVARR